MVSKPLAGNQLRQKSNRQADGSETVLDLDGFGGFVEDRVFQRVFENLIDTFDAGEHKVQLPGRAFLGGRRGGAFSFSLGIRTVSTPARIAARLFSFKPPIGSTKPRNVISPVIATSFRTGVPVKSEAMAVNTWRCRRDGPSLGTAPLGKRGRECRFL